MSEAPTATVVVPLEGEIDMANIEKVRLDVDAAIAQHPSRLVFDLSRVSFLDSSGLALFAQTTLRVDEVKVRGASALIRRVIECTGLDAILVTEP